MNMNAFALFVVLLFASCFATQMTIPKLLKQAHFKYEGTIKTKATEIPVNGEFFINILDKKIQMLDNSNLDWQGKSWNVKNLFLIDRIMKKEDVYTTINNKCLVSHYGKSIFPRLSNWREIGNNKFELVVRNRFSLSQIVTPNMKNLIKDVGNDKHDILLRIRLTWAKNKVQDAEIKLFVDDELIVTKSVDVTESIQGKVDDKIFQIPAACKNPSAEQQKKAFDLEMRLLGVDMEQEKSKSKEVQAEALDESDESSLEKENVKGKKGIKQDETEDELSQDEDSKGKDDNIDESNMEYEDLQDNTQGNEDELTQDEDSKSLDESKDETKLERQ